MDPNEWKRRDECARREQEERDRLFEKTITIARKQSQAIRMLLAEEEHQERRDDMRSAYLEHGTGFDPCQIQGSGSASSHYEEITGAPQVSSFNVLLGLEDPCAQVQKQGRGGGGQLIGGVRSPPCVPRSERTASEILSMSPPRSPQRGQAEDMLLTPPLGGSQPSRRGQLPEPMTGQYNPQQWYCPPQERKEARDDDDMDLTPVARPAPPRVPSMRDDDDMELTPVAGPSVVSTMRPEHQALLERARRTVEMATRQLNILPSSSPHPLSLSFSSQSRQPLATLYSTPQPGPSGMQEVPGTPTGRPTRSRPTLPACDPQLQFRSRLASQSPPSPARAVSAAPTRQGFCPEEGPERDLVCPKDVFADIELRMPPSSRLLPPTRAASAGPSSRLRPPTRAASAGPTRSIPSSTGAIRRTASSSCAPATSTRQSVRAAAAAGTLKGTQSEIEAMGFQGRNRDEKETEWQFVDQHITPYRQCPPQLQGEAVSGLTGLLKEPGAQGGRKKRVLLKRKVLKITIPPRPDSPSQEMPYMYSEQDPQYSIKHGPLLPPRRLTPSPPNTCYQCMPPHLRTTEQLQSRLDIEADWQRRQDTVPTREYPEDKKKQFGKPLPKSFTTGKPKKLPSYRGGAQASATPQPTASTSFGMAMGGVGRPQTPTTRTGLVLRTPSTPTTSRGRSVPSRGGRGGTSSRGRGGRSGSASPSPTRSAPMTDYIDQIEKPMADVLDRLDHLEKRVFEIPEKIHIDDLRLPNPMDYVNEGINMIEDFPSPVKFFDEGVDFVRDAVESGVDTVEKVIRKIKEELKRFTGGGRLSKWQRELEDRVRSASPKLTRSSPLGRGSPSRTLQSMPAACPPPTRSSPVSPDQVRELLDKYKCLKDNWDKERERLEREVEHLEDMEQQASQSMPAACPPPTRSSPVSPDQCAPSMGGASPGPTRSSPLGGSNRAGDVIGLIDSIIQKIIKNIENATDAREIQALIEKIIKDLEKTLSQSGLQPNMSPGRTRSSPTAGNSRAADIIGLVESIIRQIIKNIEGAGDAGAVRELIEKIIKDLERIIRQLDQGSVRGHGLQSNMRGPSPGRTRSSPAAGYIGAEASRLSCEVDNVLDKIMQDVEGLRNDISHLDGGLEQELGVQPTGDRESTSDRIEEMIAVVEILLLSLKERIDKLINH